MALCERCIDELMKFLKYIWDKVQAITAKDLFCFITVISIVLLACWVSLVFFDVEEWLKHIVKTWIEPVPVVRSVMALYVISIIVSITYIWKHCTHKVHLTIYSWCVLAVLVGVYSYYRFSNASPFVFYGPKYFCWADIIYVFAALLVGCDISFIVRQYRLSQKESQENSIIVRDDAISNECDDLFGFSDIIKEVQLQIDAVDVSQRAFSIGVTGEWGIGKSSFINLFAKQAKANAQIVVHFFPRNAKKTESIQEEFFTALTAELRKYSYNINHVINKYAYALKFDSSVKWIYYIIDCFSHWTAASEKEQINEMIRSTGKKIYVFIEDLDRLTGPEILEVLKLIDANGNFCNTIFMSAYDKTYVNDVLQKIIGFDGSKSEFTNKYFQYELPIAIQLQSVLSQYLDKYLFQYAIDTVTEPFIKHNIRQEWTLVCIKLLSHLTTLRQIKRFVNYFRIEYRTAWSRVDFGDFAIVSLIRFLDIATYNRLLKKELIQFEGTTIFSDHSQYTLREQYKQKVELSTIPSCAQLLDYLFGQQQGERQFDDVYNRIFRAESFYNYFYKQTNKIYYDDLRRMISATTLSEAIGVMDDYQTRYNSAEGSIREYLTLMTPRMIRNIDELRRYIGLLIYSLEKIESTYLSMKIQEMLSVDTRKKFSKIVSEREYVDVAMSALDDVMECAPYILCVIMRSRLNDRIKSMHKESESMIESEIKDEQLIIDAQQKYDAFVGTDAWEAKKSIALASWIPGENKKYYAVRRKHLSDMLFRYPDNYAAGILDIQAPQYDQTYTLIEAPQYNTIIGVIGDNKRVDKWIRRIKNANYRYIMSAMRVAIEEGNNPIIRIEKYIKNNREDIELIVKEIKREQQRKKSKKEKA